jgi:hypothetical protein
VFVPVHVQLVIHGISNDDECIATSKVCSVFYFCMHVVQANGVACTFFFEQVAVFRWGNV